MFLPIGDEPNPRGTPAATYALIAVNVLVFLFISLPQIGHPIDPADPALPHYLSYLAGRFPDVSPRRLLAESTAYDLFVFENGFRPAAASVWSLLTSLFLHAGWWHLLGNMLFLWIFGANVEARLGRLGYLAIYLATGIAATLLYAAFQLDSSAPLIGASGAISGVLGCYFWWFPQNRVRVLVVLFVFIDVWRVPARIVLAVFVVVDNLLPLLAGGAGGEGVAYGAHLGGFVAGLGAAAALGRGRGAPQPGAAPSPSWWTAPRAKPQHASAGLDGAVGHGALPERSFESAVAAGAWGEAACLYAHLLPRERLELEAEHVVRLVDGLQEHGDAQAALNVVQSFIAGRPTSPLLAAAHLRAGLLHLHHSGRLVAAEQHFLAALDLAAPPALEERARAGLAAVALARQAEH